IEPIETATPPSSTTTMAWAAASRRDIERATCFNGGGIGLTVPRPGQGPTRTFTPAPTRRLTASGRERTDWDGRTRWGTSVAPIRIPGGWGGYERGGPVCPPGSPVRPPSRG